MKPWTAVLAAMVLVVSLAMTAGGLGLFGWASALWRETPIVPAAPDRLLTNFGLVGVILILLGLLVAVLARGPYAPHVRRREAQEARMVQDLYRGFTEMEARLESLESTVLRRPGSFSLGMKHN